MKWKLTGQFLIAVVTIVAIVVVVNTFVLLYMLAQRTTDTGGSNENVARDIIEAHQFTVELTSEVGGGTKVTIHFA